MSDALMSQLIEMISVLPTDYVLGVACSPPCQAICLVVKLISVKVSTKTCNQKFAMITTKIYATQCATIRHRSTTEATQVVCVTVNYIVLLLFAVLAKLIIIH